MKIKISIFEYCFLLGCAAFIIQSCEPPADEEFTQAAEKVYVGKPDSLMAQPGYQRNKLSWTLLSDPKITKAKIFWTNAESAENDQPIPNQRASGRDSLEVDIQRIDGNQKLEATVDRLREGVYNFEVYTYDKDGNSSVKSEVIGEVYGNTYKSSLANRPLKKAAYFPYLEKAVFSWFGISQQAVIVEVEYTNTSNVLINKQIIKVKNPEPGQPPYFSPIDTIADYKPGTSTRYRTGYLPTQTAIDTFYTPYKNVELETAYILILQEVDVLKNNGDILEYEDWDGERWGIPKDWITNPQVQNMGQWGGFDGYHDGGYLSVEKWNDSADEVENGKLYQTITLPEGEYTFEVDFDSKNINDDGFIIINEGTTLPDVSNVDDAIAYADMKDNDTLDFTLTSETEVSIGFLVNFFQNKSNFRAHNMKIFKKEWK